MHDHSTNRIAHLLAAVAMPLALVAAFIAATPIAAQPSGSSLALQVWTCPAGYEGEDYLTDCTPGPDGYDVNVVSGDYDQIAASDDNGDIAFAGIPAGQTTASLNVLGETAGFYYSCFDVTSGTEEYLFDGVANAISYDAVDGTAISCRWYVTPAATGSPSPAPSDDTFGASAEFRVFDCPVAYDGDDYLADCAPTSDENPVEVLLSGGPELDPDTALSGTTDADGYVTFLGLDAGTWTAYLNIPGEFATFYLACFDATGGGETFLYDAGTNLTTFELAEDATISCRWYIIPEDLRGSDEPSASATTEPSASATASPVASASGGPISGLPSTGAGTGTGGTTLPGGALAAAAIMAAFAVAFVTRRLVTMTRA